MENQNTITETPKQEKPLKVLVTPKKSRKEILSAKKEKFNKKIKKIEEQLNSTTEKINTLFPILNKTKEQYRTLFYLNRSVKILNNRIIKLKNNIDTIDKALNKPLFVHPIRPLYKKGNTVVINKHSPFKPFNPDGEIKDGHIVESVADKHCPAPDDKGIVVKAKNATYYTVDFKEKGIWDIYYSYLNPI